MTDAEKWEKAVTDSRNLIKWLEARNDEKTARIRALEHQIAELKRNHHA
ncbi:hypothetical protein [Citricoccus sp. NR2]|nr:hypothetical protein [Citricoccus sp. NR2]WBL19203.1 hypothetical protein O1A05_00400 [Citricoccus sp. NR2]